MRWLKPLYLWASLRKGYLLHKVESKTKCVKRIPMLSVSGVNRTSVTPSFNNNIAMSSTNKCVNSNSPWFRAA